MRFDAIVVVSFGGPEGAADVEGFLDNVLQGRAVPPERRQRVAEQYREVGGVSPINAFNRGLVASVRAAAGRAVYWGNRNWHPYLADTVAGMATDGVRHAAAFVTSAYSSYSGCRQYLEDIDRARAAVGDGAPEIVKLRPFFNHPGFVEPLADGLRRARAQAGHGAPVLMTAHSIPAGMAATCDYEAQLRETARLVAEGAGEPVADWSLVYQSRSGPPGQPWLGPDVNDAIRALDPPPPAVIVVPIGFVSDHMEVVYDLDRTAAATASARGIRLLRTPTPGTDARFVDLILDLVDELERPGSPGRALGLLGPVPVPCPPGHCPPAAASRPPS